MRISFNLKPATRTKLIRNIATIFADETLSCSCPGAGREQCGNYLDELRGDLAKGVIKWEGRGAYGSWRPSMTDWVKAQ